MERLIPDDWAVKVRLTEWDYKEVKRVAELHCHGDMERTILSAVHFALRNEVELPRPAAKPDPRRGLRLVKTEEATA